MDGTGWITQCPIQPGQSFRHNFTAEPGGTFWYHSHVGAQRTDGLLGAFVVRDEQYRYTMAGEAPFVMVLQDWYHHPSTTVAFGGFGPNNFFNGPSEKAFFPKSIDGFYSGEAVFVSALINGKGRMVSANGTDNSAPLTEFNVTSGKTYAFRVVGAQFVYAMRISVDDHQITVTSRWEPHSTAASRLIYRKSWRTLWLQHHNQDGSEWREGKLLDSSRGHHRWMEWHHACISLPSDSSWQVHFSRFLPNLSFPEQSTGYPKIHWC